MQISGHKTRSILDRHNLVSEKDLSEALEKTLTYLVAAAEEERKRQPVEIQSVQWENAHISRTVRAFVASSD